MSKIYKLAEMIVKDGKMTNDEVIEKLSKAIESDNENVYSELYEEAYGKVLTRQIAEEKVKCMAVTDGSDRADGQKWTYDQTVDVGNKIAISWQEVSKSEWYFVMNMLYSDFYRTAKYAEKQNDPLFFAYMARDWFYDDDAPEDKTYRYVFCVL